MIVVKEQWRGAEALSVERREGGAIHQVDVEPAVVVVVDQPDAGARGLDDELLLPRAGAMMKLIQSGLLRDVRKYDRCAVHKPTCRDRAGLGVLDRGPSRAGRDSHICEGGLCGSVCWLFPGTAERKRDGRRKMSKRPDAGERDGSPFGTVARKLANSRQEVTQV